MIIRRHIPEYGNLNIHRHESLKSYSSANISQKVTDFMKEVERTTGLVNSGFSSSDIPRLTT